MWQTLRMDKYVCMVNLFYTRVHTKTVTIKCLASFNFYAIAYVAFSYGYWNVHVYNI